MTENELLEKLREYAEWAMENEWATPIDLSDTLLAAAEKIVALDLENERLTAQCDHLREGAERAIEPYFYTDDARGHGSTADFSLRDFGKSVFLTREEAEAALREVKKDE